MHGARYLHVLVPCPLGWGSESCHTVRIARLATQSGLFPLFEAEGGEVVRSTPIRHRVPVEEYLKLQKRYAHLFSPVRRDDVIDRLQARADRNVERYGLEEASA
jgi:pyruvate ferredoxin oxidoreductase beta subunit